MTILRIVTAGLQVVMLNSCKERFYIMRTRSGRYIYESGKNANIAHFEEKIRKRWSYLFEGDEYPRSLKLNRRAETKHRIRHEEKGIDINLTLQIFTRAKTKNKSVIEFRAHSNKSELILAYDLDYYIIPQTDEEKAHNNEIFFTGLATFTLRILRSIYDEK